MIVASIEKDALLDALRSGAALCTGFAVVPPATGEPYAQPATERVYWVEPGGAVVESAIARELFRSYELVERQDGLFSGTSQSWQLR